MDYITIIEVSSPFICLYCLSVHWSKLVNTQYFVYVCDKRVLTLAIRDRGLIFGIHTNGFLPCFKNSHFRLVAAGASLFLQIHLVVLQIEISYVFSPWMARCPYLSRRASHSVVFCRGPCYRGRYATFRSLIVL